MTRAKLGSVLTALLLSAAVGRTASTAIPAGATISVRMTDALDSKNSRSGETFRATLNAPVTMNGTVVIPKGAEAIGRITDVESSGRLRGRAILAVELTAVNFDGKSLAIHTSIFQEGSASRSKQTMKIAGGATAIGTVVGLIGGAPWIGTGVGAAAGMVVQTVRGPAQIRIPAESLVSFTLLSPLPIE